MTTRRTIILGLGFSVLLVWSGWPSAAAQDQEEASDSDMKQQEQTDQKEQADDEDNYSVEDEDTKEGQAKEGGDDGVAGAKPPTDAGGESGGEDGGESQEGGKCHEHGSRVPLKSSDCKQFLLCDNGKYVVQDCAPGSVFDKKFGSCNIPRSKDGGCP